MYTDIPLFKRCCFCLPLRPGLIAWGYIKLIFNIMMLGFEAYYLHESRYWNSTTTIVILSIMTFASLVDIVFGIMFIVSAHMKNHKLMKIYYNYCLGMLVLTILFVIGYLIFICVIMGEVATHLYFVRIIETYVEELVFVLFDALLFIYMVLLVRSEVLKLESSLQCKFVNPMCAGGAADGQEATGPAVYNRLSSDPGSVYAQCTINVVD